MNTRWKNIRLKRSCKINKIAIGEDTPSDWEMQYLDISAVDSEGNVGTLETHTFANAPSRARRQVCSGDTVISTVRTYLKAIAHFEKPPENLIASTGFAVLTPNPKFDSRFLWRAVQDHDFIEQVVANSEGVGYPAIAPSCLANLPIYSPPLPEQRRIAAYLDEQTAKIDRLMDLRRRQIALLKEQRAALIQQAVTRGLNPNVPMKDSGLPWLGEIPVHWKVTVLKWQFQIVSGDSLPAEELLAEPNELCKIPVIGGNGVMGFATKSNVSMIMLAIGRVGALCGNVHLVPPPAWITDNALMVFNVRSYSLEFLWMLLMVTNLNRLANQNAQPLITGTLVKNQRVPLPSLDEQHKILAFIKEQNTKFDSLHFAYSRQLTLLAEYRAALIHECVTGQRAVLGNFNPGDHTND
jgi:type I restriction enzyme S subunit